MIKTTSLVLGWAIMMAASWGCSGGDSRSGSTTASVTGGSALPAGPEAEVGADSPEHFFALAIESVRKNDVAIYLRVIQEQDIPLSVAKYLAGQILNLAVNQEQFDTEVESFTHKLEALLAKHGLQLPAAHTWDRAAVKRLAILIRGADLHSLMRGLVAWAQAFEKALTPADEEDVPVPKLAGVERIGEDAALLHFDDQVTRVRIIKVSGRWFLDMEAALDKDFPE